MNLRRINRCFQVTAGHFIEAENTFLWKQSRCYHIPGVSHGGWVPARQAWWQRFLLSMSSFQGFPLKSCTSGDNLNFKFKRGLLFLPPSLPHNCSWCTRLTPTLAPWCCGHSRVQRRSSRLPAELSGKNLPSVHGEQQGRRLLTFVPKDDLQLINCFIQTRKCK